ncbi:ribosomal-protein-alanine N-acetyltransferase, partial [Proteus mirabilis]
VRESNQKASNLYESIGFNSVSVRKNYYPTATGKEDAIIMDYPIKF